MATKYVVHKDQVPMRVRSLKEPYVDDGKVRLRNSTFHVTCNTNFRPKTNEESRIAASNLRIAAQDTFANQARLIPLVTFLNGDQWSEKIIKDVDVLIGVELGTHPKGTRIHCHIKVAINHYSKIHLNPKVIKEHMILNSPGKPFVHYVHISIHSPVFSLEDYIRRDRDLFLPN